MKTIHGFTPSENAAFNRRLRKQLVAEAALVIVVEIAIVVLFLSFTL
jgi:hypothetical protein